MLYRFWSRATCSSLRKHILSADTWRISVVVSPGRYCFMSTCSTGSAPLVKQDLITAVIHPEADHTATVIFLHGLGQRGGSWASRFQTIRIPYIKYIFPTAPIVPVTWQNGAEMPAWFNIKNLSYHEYDLDELGIKRASKMVHSMLHEEIENGIPSDRIILAGFSQGGGLALHSGLSFELPLAALVGLSCRFPQPQRAMLERQVNVNIPILHCYGDADTVTPVDIARKVENTIAHFTKQHTSKLYPKLAHLTCEQELNDVTEFVAKHLPPL